MKISVDDKADRDALAAILARNGYIVKMTRYKKTAKSNAYGDRPNVRCAGCRSDCDSKL